MNDNVKSLITNATTDVSGKWISIDNAEKLVTDTVRACIVLVKNTPMHCAITTHDLGSVECTIDHSVNQIKNYFNITGEIQ